MKQLLLLFCASASLLSAGIPMAPKDSNPKGGLSPAKDSLWNWFVGGSGGYLLDAEEDLWTAHLGVDLPIQFLGFDQALFLEVGFAQLNGGANLTRTRNPLPARTAAPLKGFSTGGPSGVFDADLDMIPLSLNWKLERQLTGAFNFYLGGGAGVAFLDSKLDGDSSVKAAAPSSSFKDEDTVFFAQIFAGVVANLTEHFELFAGARWIYFDQPDFKDDGLSWDSDGIGLDNDDFLLEGGGRVNF